MEDVTATSSHRADESVNRTWEFLQEEPVETVKNHGDYQKHVRQELIELSVAGLRTLSRYAQVILTSASILTM